MPTPEEPSSEPKDLRSDRRSKQEFLKILRRAGYPNETLDAVEHQFGDYIDYAHDADALERLSISVGMLDERFDSSP